MFKKIYKSCKAPPFSDWQFLGKGYTVSLIFHVRGNHCSKKCGDLWKITNQLHVRLGSVKHLSLKLFLSHHNHEIYHFLNAVKKLWEWKWTWDMYISLRHDTWGKWELRNANFQLFIYFLFLPFLERDLVWKPVLLHATFCHILPCYFQLRCCLWRQCLVMFSGKLTPQKTKASLEVNTQPGEQSRDSPWGNSSKLGHSGNLEKRPSFFFSLSPSLSLQLQAYRIAV